jgi:uncharacterized protein (DUF952 family)
MIFHIAERAIWDAAKPKGVYEAESLRSQGFIHCSTIEQVIPTANRFYRGRADLVLLCIDEAALESEIRYEEGEPGQQFPHIYGAVNLDAVRQAREFKADAGGGFSLPAIDEG